MKKETEEALEAYKIRIDALEIVNEAYLAKIEALELLNKNLQFLRDVRQSGGKMPSAGAVATPTSAPAINGEKRGRGRPRKITAAAPAAENAEPKRRGRPRLERPEAAPAAAAAATEEKRGRGRPRKTEASAAQETESKKRGPKAKGSSITRLQFPLETWLRDNLAEEGFNKATFRALTGILLCLFENGTATVSTLHEYIGGSRVTVVRHTAFLKKIKLLVYEGSRKKGHYALTPQGKALHERLANA